MKVLWKRIGETPLEALESYRLAAGIASDIPLTYAGRLDPMAEGVLIALEGGECKEKERYLNLDKEYEFEVLFGASSDTGDVLGLCKIVSCTGGMDEGRVRAVAERFVGKHVFPYPRFSSKTVQGKHLHEWARSGEEVAIPSREVEIYSLTMSSAYYKSSSDILSEVLRKIDLLSPQKDFRQEEIEERWKKLLAEDRKFLIARFSARVSSGTYIRTLAEKIGEATGCAALAYSIRRTRVGGYFLN